MSKDKRQLRAEAVERLEKLRRTDYSWDDVIEAMLAERDPRYTIVSQLIDLLTDDEQPDTFHDDFYDCETTVDAGEQDSREKLEADVRRNFGELGFGIKRTFEWLDRQAAITKAEQREWWGDVVAELIAERDEWKAKAEQASESYLDAKSSCDELRNQLYEQPNCNGLRETALDYTERLGEASKTIHIETQCAYDDLRVLCKTLMGVFE